MKKELMKRIQEKIRTKNRKGKIGVPCFVPLGKKL